MTPDELRSIISQPEGLKLDFKREYKLSNQAPANPERQLWKQLIDGQWEELIKDILALTNGNSGTARQKGLLIIGVDDQLQSDGTRQLYDTSTLQLSQRQVIDKVNAACHPPVPNIEVDRVILDGNSILVISIPPSPHVHETTCRIEPKKGNFSNGTLVNIQSGTSYSEHSVFIRHGESIQPASQAEREVLERERLALLPEFKQSRLLSLISIVEKIRECTRESLIENQQVLTPFLYGRAERDNISYQLYQLFDGQRNRSEYEEWLSFLRESLVQEQDTQIRAIVKQLITVVTRVMKTFYSYYKTTSHLKMEEMHLRKHLLAKAIHNSDISNDEAILIARNYLDDLRKSVDSMGRNLGKLRALAQ